MLLHPAKHYIVYLISRRSLGVPQILDRLQNMNLPVPQKGDKEARETLEAQIHQVKDSMSFPPGFNPRVASEETKEFLRYWKIQEAWEDGPYMQSAKALLFNPPVLRMARTLLLSPVNHKDVADRIRKRFNMKPAEMNPLVLKLFGHYFWDYGAVDREMWVKILTQWMPTRCDDMIAALKAPRTTGGAALAVALVDQSAAGETDSITIYSTVREMAFQKFMEHMMAKSSLQNTNAALMSLDMVIKADNELDKRRGGGAELLAEITRIKPIYDKPDVLKASDLYTNDSLPEGSYVDVPDEPVDEERTPHDPDTGNT